MPGLLKTISEANFQHFVGPQQLIKDVRGCDTPFTLQQQGFTFQRWSPSELDWSDENQITDCYLPQVKGFLLEQLKDGNPIERCEAFDWRVS